MKYKKICKCCGKEFETNSPQKLFCNREHYLPCPVCGKPVLKKDRDFTRPAQCCSSKCAHIKRRGNFRQRKCAICGDMFTPTSGINTICSKEHHMVCSICGKDMIVTPEMWHDKIDTCSRECAKEKVRRFYREKYGVDHPMQSKEVQEHFKKAMKDKYGVEHALQLKRFLEDAQETNLEKYGTKYACLRPECSSKSPVPIVSAENKRIGKLLTNMNLEVEYEKIVDSRAFDIYLPKYETLIEIDPTYTHNSLYNHWNSPLSRDYHQKKTQVASENGYRCVHIFEWDDIPKIINRFQDSLTIGARQCKLKNVDTTTCNQFLRKYHIQGSVYGQKYILGLYYNNELVQVMSFGKARYDKSYDAELLRLCSKWGVHITGGAARMFKKALKDNPQWKSIISYCDLAKFTGEVYPRLGMKLVRTTPPQEIWSKGTDKITATLLRQRGFDQLFGTNFGKGTSNEQLMIDDEWLPVYDCGQAVYEYRR